MNRLEDRLREAFGAAADTVRPESLRALREVQRRPALRRLAPLATAAAVAVVIVGATVLASLALSGGRAPAGPSGHGASSPAASASPSGGTGLTVPMVVGMAQNQAILVLQGAELNTVVTAQAYPAEPPGVVIAQNPAAGVRVAPGATVALTVSTGAKNTRTRSAATSPGAGSWTTVSSARYAVTFRVPGNWRPTPNLGPVVGYHGASGWVTVQDAAESAGLRAACTAVATQNVHHTYGTQPRIVYRTIDGRPGCLILPSGDAPDVSAPPGGPAMPMTSALVEYRQPVSGDNFLFLSADPVNLVTIVDTIQLHH